MSSSEVTDIRAIPGGVDAYDEAEAVCLQQVPKPTGGTRFRFDEHSFPLVKAISHLMTQKLGRPISEAAVYRERQSRRSSHQQERRLDLTPEERTNREAACQPAERDGPLQSLVMQPQRKKVDLRGVRNHGDESDGLRNWNGFHIPADSPFWKDHKWPPQQ